MKLLIDGDVFVYECAFAAQKTLYTWRGKTYASADDCKAYVEEAGHDYRALRRAGEITSEVQVLPKRTATMILKQRYNKVLDECAADDAIIYISGKKNFRDEVADTKPYKGNRLDAVKPEHYAHVRDKLLKEYGAIVVEGEEADDRLGIAQCAATSRSTAIVTIDKDLNMIPGRHYNWQKGTRFTITEEQGLYVFHKQLLTGDATDNIPGLKGIGPVKAASMLEALSPPEAWDVVRAMYAAEGHDESYLTEMMQLLWIRRKENELITPDIYEQEYL